jgi:hypothetical protein
VGLANHPELQPVDQITEEKVDSGAGPRQPGQSQRQEARRNHEEHRHARPLTRGVVKSGLKTDPLGAQEDFERMQVLSASVGKLVALQLGLLSQHQGLGVEPPPGRSCLQPRHKCPLQEYAWRNIAG